MSLPSHKQASLPISIFTTICNTVHALNSIFITMLCSEQTDWHAADAHSLPPEETWDLRSNTSDLTWCKLKDLRIDLDLSSKTCDHLWVRNSSIVTTQIYSGNFQVSRINNYLEHERSPLPWYWPSVLGASLCSLHGFMLVLTSSSSVSTFYWGNGLGVASTYTNAWLRLCQQCIFLL